jgi:hypothetical protein
MKALLLKALNHKKCGGGICVVAGSDKLIKFACHKCCLVWQVGRPVSMPSDWTPIKNKGSVRVTAQQGAAR